MFYVKPGKLYYRCMMFFLLQVITLKCRSNQANLWCPNFKVFKVRGRGGEVDLKLNCFSPSGVSKQKNRSWTLIMINGGNSFPDHLSINETPKTSSICVQTFNLILSFQFGAIKLIGRSIFSRHGIFKLHFTIKFSKHHKTI